MIKEVSLNGIATFTEPISMKPLKINFCYGSNGSGKTTISTVIANYPTNTKQISWSTPSPLQTVVYNRDFVNTNFGETSRINGIFTLGQENKETLEFIADQREKIDACIKQIDAFTKSKEQLMHSQQQQESKIDEVCWKVKLKYDQSFKEAFKGFNASKKTFRERCLAEAKQKNSASQNFDEIKRQYGIAFEKDRLVYQAYSLIDINEIKEWEKCELLSQKISGSADTPIGKFFEYLNNSDWIKLGIPFADNADGKCPFCQQELPRNTYDDIKAFFDDSYERDVSKLKAFLSGYSEKTQNIIEILQEYIKSPLPILEYSLFKAELDAIIVKVDSNIREIKRKLSSPSVVAILDSLCPILDRMNKVFAGFNKTIDESNDFAKNQKVKQTDCIKAVWQIVVSELKVEIDGFNKETDGNKNGIKKLDDKITEQTKQQKEANRLILEKEATLTSVKPTADAINLILKRFGFEGFSIIENTDELGTYKIIRVDGKSVEKTLSEGEYNFLCFLYFYHLIYGSQNKTGIAQPKVVVIDDPISSLDSNVLFIVSTLTKQIIDDCKNGREGIKQVFILTHNIYFHKEVTFLGSRQSWKKNEAAFWIVKKKGNVSGIVDHKNNNPIQTSYELLWSELKDTDSVQRITIFNTLRRILEYYFNIIGGLDYEKCINGFDGEDMLICKSLISCINEGSHFITDDFVMQYESAAMESYIRVFKLIFEKMGHGSHYKMMMNSNTGQNNEEPA